MPKPGNEPFQAQYDQIAQVEREHIAQRLEEHVAHIERENIAQRLQELAQVERENEEASVTVFFHYKAFGYPLKGADPIRNLKRHETNTITKLIETIDEHYTGLVLRNYFWIRMPLEIDKLRVSADGEAYTTYYNADFRYALTMDTDLWTETEAKGFKVGQHAYIIVLIPHSDTINTKIAEEYQKAKG